MQTKNATQRMEFNNQVNLFCFKRFYRIASRPLESNASWPKSVTLTKSRIHAPIEPQSNVVPNTQTI